MTVEEEIKELEEQLDKNNYKLQQLDIQQAAYKLIINSAYGAISSRQNPVGDDDLGNSITVMGSTSIQHVNKIVIEFVKKKIIEKLMKELESDPDNSEEIKNEIEKTKKASDIPGVLVANDTDSAMFSLSKCGIKICDGDHVTDEGYALVDECDNYINEEFVKWYEKLTNSHNCRLNFKREKICDCGIWLKKKGARKYEDEGEAKKNYVVHILDNEGVKHPKFKYTGVKFAKSVIPGELKELGKKIVENMLTTQDRQCTDRLVQKLYGDFIKLPIDSKAIIQRCHDMKKYDNGDSDEFILKTPGHIRAALSYNRVLKELKLNKYQKIKSGDIAKIVFVEPNKFGIERLAYLDSWPKEFDNMFKIDNKKMFENVLYEEIKRFYSSVDWPSFNPTDEYAFSLFDLLES